MPAAIGQELVALLPRLRRFALVLCRSQTLADDLVQGACERALARADSWAPGSRFDAWMLRILHNHWIDHLRRTRAEGMTEDVTTQTQLIGDAGEDPIFSRLVLSKVQKAIDALPQEQREVLVLVCGEDLSYREAAEILNVPVGTVMSRLARARKRLVEMTAAA
ncbi:RNA polymerase sigma factor [Microvirga arsenatis]|uniref:Sigma-70 family RNA polymerase sigma factor n=1 Tax=Microvirga arsenatis TaxID=2692265 RepID=A0ABW9Z097_9HYPH|nr:RNA polymerase sigma factor [Microvirga arsenatis]NBJ11088.1 sigma-70 family RNA polymerase sigma factor [Microvirga arsenatis]NBJ25361.1 sigma-70 family RNA polymerase sigma factor [Microvirga arsenatis]